MLQGMCQGETLGPSCPREWDPTYLAQGQEGNLWQGRKMNLELLQTQTCGLISVLCGHKHWRYFQSHHQEKQQFTAQRGKHHEMGSFHLFYFTLPISKLKMKVRPNVLSTSPNLSSRTKKSHVEGQLSAPTF